MTKHNKYWFKTRPYGYGWVPVTWQGLVVVVVFILVVGLGSFGLSFILDENTDLFMIIYMSGIVLSTGLLILTVRMHGPKSRWRWGKSDKDDPNKDFIVK